jgi:hypothetical protein
MVENYKPNSHKSKEEPALPEKKAEKAIVGSAKVKKKSDIQKFIADVFSEDADSVGSYVLMDVLIPAFKKAILVIITNSIDMLFGVEIKNGSSASKVSYGSCYEGENRRRDHGSFRTKTGYSYDDVILDNRGEAEDVLSRMDELISAYGLVSVADLYGLMGINGNYTDNKYGWTDIRSASVFRVRDGYMLKLPKVLPLN